MKEYRQKDMLPKESRENKKLYYEGAIEKHCLER